MRCLVVGSGFNVRSAYTTNFAPFGVGPTVAETTGLRIDAGLTTTKGFRVALPSIAGTLLSPSMANDVGMPTDAIGSAEPIR